MTDANASVPEQSSRTARLIEEGLNLLGKHALEPAEAIFAQILSAEPRQFTAMHCLGIIKNLQGQPEAAVPVLAEALRIVPTSALAHLNLGIALANLNRPEEALAHYEQSLALKPDNPDALLNCSAVLNHLGRSPEALAKLDHLVQLQPNLAEARLNRGVVLRDLRRWEEALADLEQAVSLRPDLGLAHLNLGMVFQDLSRLEEALASLDRAVALQPGSSLAHEARGRVVKSMGRSDLELVLPKYTPPQRDQVGNHFVPLFYGTSNPDAVAAAAKEICTLGFGGSHFSDNLLTWGRNMSMMDDATFVWAWQSNAESEADRSIVWRRYVLACAAFHCVQLPGDFVECGAYTGVGMKTLMDYLGGQAFPKTYWGYDIFEHDASMLNHSMPAHGAGLYERVQKKFADYPQVRLVKGLIPQSFEGNCPDRIAFMHIDMNQAPAEIAALEHLFERMVPGAILILDDYEWSGYREQKLAEDQWFDQRRYRVMPLPTGQGMVFKR